MSTYAGTSLLTRQALRRDRLIAPIWVALLAVVLYASAAATPALYDTTTDRVRAAEAINDNAAVVALYGPILDPHSLGEVAMTKMTVLYALFVAILLVVLVRRHTRVEEESGRLELLGGTAVGRDAPLASAVVEAVAISLGIGAVAALVNIAGGLPAAGSVAFGAMWAGTGLVAAGIALVACQMSASARTCAAIAAAALGGLYLLRAVGDTSVRWLSWLSPFGWNTQFRAWSDTRWWMLLLYVALSAALVGVANLLRARRDLGAGIVAPRPGPATGSPRLADALALAIRVHGATILTWSVACAALGMVFGAIAPGVGNLLGSADAQQMIARLGGTGALADALVAAVLSIVAIVVTCFAISVIGHAASDEAGGRTEAVLATATSRSQWFGATSLVAFAGALWLLLATGAFLWLGYGLVGAPPGSHPGRIVGAALSWAPAVWLVAAVAAGLFAYRRGWTAIGWALPAVCLVISLVGDLLELPGWFTGISPYQHVSPMPTEDFAVVPALVMTGLAAVVLAAARWRFARRDIG